MVGHSNAIEVYLPKLYTILQDYDYPAAEKPIGFWSFLHAPL